MDRTPQRNENMVPCPDCPIQKLGPRQDKIFLPIEAVSMDEILKLFPNFWEYLFWGIGILVSSTIAMAALIAKMTIDSFNKTILTSKNEILREISSHASILDDHRERIRRIENDYYKPIGGS